MTIVSAKEITPLLYLRKYCKTLNFIHKHCRITKKEPTLQKKPVQIHFLECGVIY